MNKTSISDYLYPLPNLPAGGHSLQPEEFWGQKFPLLLKEGWPDNEIILRAEYKWSGRGG